MGEGRGLSGGWGKGLVGKWVSVGGEKEWLKVGSGVVEASRVFQKMVP